MKDNEIPEEKAWELLKKKRNPVISPFFSRNVLRMVRQTEQKSTFWKRPWLKVALLPLTACVVIAAIVKMDSLGLSTSKTEVADVTVDFETITDLDLLVSNDETILWLDTSF